ncbi:hypothetical protein EDD85DRAFT_868397 [Armillaria nabsnona]|nr:hypothetical protein EDD85DRAFT_868397 [Armillaria nabsnona]
MMSSSLCLLGFKLTLLLFYHGTIKQSSCSSARLGLVRRETGSGVASMSSFCFCTKLRLPCIIINARTFHRYHRDVYTFD